MGSVEGEQSQGLLQLHGIGFGSAPCELGVGGGLRLRLGAGGDGPLPADLVVALQLVLEFGLAVYPGLPVAALTRLLYLDLPLLFRTAITPHSYLLPLHFFHLLGSLSWPLLHSFPLLLFVELPFQSRLVADRIFLVDLLGELWLFEVLNVPVFDVGRLPASGLPVVATTGEEIGREGGLEGRRVAVGLVVGGAVGGTGRGGEGGGELAVDLLGLLLRVAEFFHQLVVAGLLLFEEGGLWGVVGGAGVRRRGLRGREGGEVAVDGADVGQHEYNCSIITSTATINPLKNIEFLCTDIDKGVEGWNGMMS
jgi:hypothetical protein